MWTRRIFELAANGVTSGVLSISTVSWLIFVLQRDETSKLLDACAFQQAGSYSIKFSDAQMASV